MCRKPGSHDRKRPRIAQWHEDRRRNRGAPSPLRNSPSSARGCSQRCAPRVRRALTLGRRELPGRGRNLQFRTSNGRRTSSTSAGTSTRSMTGSVNESDVRTARSRNARAPDTSPCGSPPMSSASSGSSKPGACADIAATRKVHRERVPPGPEKSDSVDPPHRNSASAPMPPRLPAR